MGHYDDCYEHDYERERLQKRKQAIETLKRLEPLMEELDTVIRQEFPSHHQTPHPFKSCWYDLQKEYIAWQYEEGLVIKDPNIIIDVLKDDK